MTISFFDQIASSAKLVLVPLIGTSSLDNSLEQIASDYNLSVTLLQQNFKAESDETHLIYTQNQCIILLGLGQNPTFKDLIKKFRRFSHRNRNMLSKKLTVNFLYQPINNDIAKWIEACVNGLILGTYQIGRFKTKDNKQHPFQQSDSILCIGLPASQKAIAKNAAKKGLAIAETQIRIFDLVNAPSNKKLPANLAQWAIDSGKKVGFAIQIMEKEEIQKTGLHALLAVNKGSAEPPVFIVMEYKPAHVDDTPLPKVGLVGKGITFDTGGLSIKPSTNMHYMKSDMGGAGAVLGTMEMVAKLQLPVHLIGIVPSTDNAVDALAIQPSDVISSYSGKTIEIIDTDAEGRLVLADGLSYMVQNFQPEILIDLATLTGSAVRTFGYHAAALFSNDDNLADQFAQLGEQTGEQVWRLPLWDIYKDDIKSDVADVRNFSGRPLAGAIGAAKFLEVFTHEHPRWMHLDIAGVAFSDSEFTIQKSATAYGIRLLTEYLSSLCSEK